MRLALTSAGDLSIVNGRLQLVEGRDAIPERLTTRLRTFLGEWEFDRRVGVPYFESILRKRFDIRVVANILRRVILGTDGIARITELLFDFDPATRSLSVQLEAEGEDGEPLSLSFSEVIL